MKKWISLLAAAVWLTLLFPAIAMAQEPTDQCLLSGTLLTDTTKLWDFNVDDYGDDWRQITAAEYQTLIGGSDYNSCGTYAQYANSSYGNLWYDATCSPGRIFGLISEVVVASPTDGTETTIKSVDPFPNPTNNGVYLYCVNEAITSKTTLEGTHFVGTKYTTIPAGSVCRLFYYRASSSEKGVRSVEVTCGTGTYPEEYQPEAPPVVRTCDLVTNPDFDSLSGWSGFGSVITDSVAILYSGATMSQNVSVAANTSYSAVLSVTQVVTGETATLEVTLGAETEPVEVVSAGTYTVTLTTPERVSGPLTYRIDHLYGGDVGLDFTCLYRSSAGECLAPPNGSFETAESWDWYRGAEWTSSTQNAWLPYNPGDDADRSLLMSTAAYTLPTLTAGEYLLMSYQAGTPGQVARLNAKVGATEFEQEIFAGPYDYETDLSNLAGQSVQVAFANSGAAAGSFAAQDDISLDDICIFVSDHGPDLPAPTDTVGVSPVNFGFTYGCRDTTALLAGYGINIYNQINIYNAGVTVWDPVNWVPWLASALWVNVGAPVTCFLLEFMRLVVGMTQAVLNTMLNYINWTRLSAQSGLYWWQSGVLLLKNTANNYGTFSRAALSSWGNWFARSANAGQTLFSQSGRNLGSWFSGWTGWLPGYLNNLANGQTNIIVNTFLSVWNDSLAPYLASVAAIPTAPNVDGFPGGNPISFLNDTWNLLLAAANLFWFGVQWYFTQSLGVAQIPLTLYRAFQEGAADPGFALMLDCADNNFWCKFIAGVWLVNATVGDTVMYPIVIVIMVVISLTVIFRDMVSMLEINIS